MKSTQFGHDQQTERSFSNAPFTQRHKNTKALVSNLTIQHIRRCNGDYTLRIEENERRQKRVCKQPNFSLFSAKFDLQKSSINSALKLSVILSVYSKLNCALRKQLVDAYTQSQLLITTHWMCVKTS